MEGPGSSLLYHRPRKESGELKDILRSVTYGWGMIPVVARIGETEWTTSLFPKDGHYIVPIRANVRKAEKIQEGDMVTVHFEVIG